MSRYYFHTMDRSEVRDTDGLNFPDLASARKAAVIFSGELLIELGEQAYDTELKVTVTNEDDLTLWEIIVVANEALALKR